MEKWLRQLGRNERANEVETFHAFVFDHGVNGELPSLLRWDDTYFIGTLSELVGESEVRIYLEG